MTKLKKGDKVKCINDEFDYTDPELPKEYRKITVPVEGKLYLIREVVDSQQGKGIRLEEINNKPIYHDRGRGGWHEPVFSPLRFKKVKK
jgi:hypothetical protein